ncbi:MAG TPA: transporter [Devosiaceae bacterium]|jgi:hypothetical protein
MSYARHLTIAAMALLPGTGAASAQSDPDALARQLSNPVASLISVPLQFNADFGAGPGGDGENLSLKIQPVIPFELSKDWNVISRTIVPLSYEHDIFPDNVAGLGDITQSFFFSPTQPGPGGIIWGVGPQFLLPTATDSRLGGGKWGLGPTGLVLMQADKLSVGVLASQLWSVAGEASRPDISQLFVQPFVSYALPEGQTLSANLEASYDWNADQWTVPLNLSYSKVFKLGEQPMSFQVGLKKYLAAPDHGPDWGVRAGLTFLFPER